MPKLRDSDTKDFATPREADAGAGPTHPRRSRLHGLSRQLGPGLALVVLILVVIGFALARNLRGINGLVDQIMRIEEPTSAAAHEMEINVLGTGLAVWKYVATGAPEHRVRATDDEADFRKFRADYDRLAATADERNLGRQLDALYERFSRSCDALMDLRDEHFAALGSAADALDEIDVILDERLQPRIEAGSTEGIAKLLTLTALEADVAEAGAWMGIYTTGSASEHREAIASSMHEARDQLAGFMALDLTPEEREQAVLVQSILARAGDGLDRAVSLHVTRRGEEAAVIELRNRLDHVLDEGIQVLARRGLAATEPEAKAAIGRLYVASTVLFGLGAAICIVAAGVLAYRSLQLQAANRDLHQEIKRRERSEAERTLLHAKLASTQERERGRLARELHDQLGQNLSVLMLGLKGLARTVVREPRTDGADTELLRLQDLTSGLIRQVHTIAWDLRPAALDDLGIHGALSSYVEDWAQRTGVRADFESSLSGVRLPGDVEIALLRMAQEALTNVLKHANARSVSLTLQRRDRGVVMVVEDDGRGFVAADEASPSAAGKHLGLLGMKERAILVGGTLEVESAPGRGTTLVVWIPVT